MKHTIFELAENGLNNELKQMIKEGVDINQKDDFGYTLLHYAISNNHEDTALLLLNNGANCTVQDNNGATPLHYAYEYGMTNVAKAIVEKNPKALIIKDKYGNQPLWTAVMNAEIPIEHIEFLLQKGADKNNKNKSGKSPYDLVKSYNIDDFTKLFEKY